LAQAVVIQHASRTHRTNTVLSTEMLSLHDLPDQVLCVVASHIVPSPDALEAPALIWQPAIRCMTASKELHFVIGEILCEALPVLATLRPLEAYKRTCWLRTVAALRRMDNVSWREIRTLQAARPQTASFTPIHTSPRLSGASICAVGDDCLMVFGGRSSVSGHTLGKTYLLKLSWSASAVSKWDEVQCKKQPIARCYHVAARFNEGVVIFGGAGDGDMLFNDTWFFKRYDTTLSDARACTAACWEELDQSSIAEAPIARSSHICAAWRRRGKLVMHGGICDSGTMGDTWSLDDSGRWMKMDTSGASVARAHHVGGIVNEHLLVHSGHDESLLTTNRVYALDLDNAVWMQVTWHDGPAPRIDAAASVIEDIGLLIFGGVGADYEFESTDAWILPAIQSARAPQKIPFHISNGALSQRACCSMCSDGLRTFIYGGFDGSEDLNDLWCLSLQPVCFHENARKSQAENADNRTLVLLWELHQRLQGT